MPMVIINPRSGRSPFQLYLLLLVTISGIPMTFGITSNIILRQMGNPYLNIWGAFLFMGGLLSLLGIYWPKDPITGMLIERTGSVALGGASFIWSVLVLWRVQLDGLFSATLTFGLALACLAQWHWINKNMTTVLNAIKHD